MLLRTLLQVKLACDMHTFPLSMLPDSLMLECCFEFNIQMQSHALHLPPSVAYS